MVRRDYIMKLIQQLFDSLFLLLNQKTISDEQKLDILDKFYKEYLGETKSFYTTASLDEILDHLKEKYGSEEVMDRLEMLSEILYHESLLSADSYRKLLFEKTLEMFLYLDDNSSTYSLIREGKIDMIKRELE